MWKATQSEVWVFHSRNVKARFRKSQNSSWFDWTSIAVGFSKNFGPPNPPADFRFAGMTLQNVGADLVLQAINGCTQFLLGKDDIF